VFVERVTLGRAEWEEWTGRLRVLTEPPAALVACLAWRSEDDTITFINVWDSASDVADFFLERAQPIIETAARLADAIGDHHLPFVTDRQRVLLQSELQESSMERRAPDTRPPAVCSMPGPRWRRHSSGSR
jgi:hypothetical protein